MSKNNKMVITQESRNNLSAAWRELNRRIDPEFMTFEEFTLCILSNDVFKEIEENFFRQFIEN